MSDNPDVPTDEDRVHALHHDYLDHLHAIQSGCEYGGGGMHGDPRTMPELEWHVQKHLRVGINGALISQGALAKLLIAKGVISDLEYWEALVAEFRDAVAGYEKELADRLGLRVRLQ